MKEIWLDLDVISIRKLCRILISAKYLNKVPDVEIPKSIKVFRTKKGYHVGCSFDKEISAIDHFMYRALLNDDPYRIKFSLQRLAYDPEGIDVTFDLKESIYPQKEAFIRQDISNIMDYVEESIDETEKKIKEAFEFETVIKFITVIPIDQDEIERVIESLEEKNIRDWRFQFALAEKEKFYIVFGDCKTSGQAFAKGMSFKEKIKTKRRTFWIKKTEFEIIVKKK